LRAAVQRDEILPGELEVRGHGRDAGNFRVLEDGGVELRGRFGLAIEAYRDSLKRRDTWFGRFLLGRTYAQLDRHPEALAELDLSIKRRGEATDVFFDDTPTERYLPPAYYWFARTQQALGVADAPKTFEQFLALRSDAEAADPLAVDAARRVASPR